MVVCGTNICRLYICRLCGLYCKIKWYENIISTSMFTQIINKTVNCYAFPLTSVRFNTDDSYHRSVNWLPCFQCIFSDVFIVSIKDQKHRT